jgi:hypothetical protein
MEEMPLHSLCTAELKNLSRETLLSLVNRLREARQSHQTLRSELASEAAVDPAEPRKKRAPKPDIDIDALLDL